jgi:hypothetical protein
MYNMSFLSPRYPSTLQMEIWQLKRTKLTGKQIAYRKQISHAAVSKTLKEANKRVISLLENGARMNKIHLNLISAKLGFARGYSHVFKVRAYLTYSPTNGVNVWYEHKGVCENCEDFVNCRKLLLLEYKERDMKVPNNALRPTTLGEILFLELEEMLK